MGSFIGGMGVKWPACEFEVPKFNYVKLYCYIPNALHK